MRKFLIALSVVVLICGMVSIAAAMKGCCVTDPIIPVPEPSTFLLLGSGLLGLIAFRIRRKR